MLKSAVTASTLLSSTFSLFMTSKCGQRHCVSRSYCRITNSVVIWLHYPAKRWSRSPASAAVSTNLFVFSLAWQDWRSLTLATDECPRLANSQTSGILLRLLRFTWQLTETRLSASPTLLFYPLTSSTYFSSTSKLFPLDVNYLRSNLSILIWF